MAKRDGFIIHEKTMAQVERLTNEQAGELLKAMILHYKGEEPKGKSQIVDVLLIDIEERMDADKESYEETSKKRKEAGLQGANKRWQNHSKAIAKNGKVMANDSKPIAKDGDSDSDSDSVLINNNMSGEPDSPPLMVAVRKIVEHLNEKAGTKYMASSRATVELIKARLNERWTVEDHIKVIDNMTTAWKGDPKMEEYLRPSTLFARAHFEEYLNRKPTARTGTNRFQNFPARQDQQHKDMVAQIIAMNAGGRT